jgi:hypothetical protein
MLSHRLPRRIRRVIVILLACTSLGMLLPAAPAAAELPPVWCEVDGSVYWCVGFDGVNVTAGVGVAPGHGYGAAGEWRVELVWYDWDQNHKRLYDPPGQAQILSHSNRIRDLIAPSDAPAKLTTSAPSWRPGVYCVRYVVWYDAGGVRWADMACRSTNND